MYITNFDTVIFDYGNVLTLWEPYNAVRDKYTEEELNQFAEDVAWRDLIERWDAGETHAQTLARIEAVDQEKGTHWAELYKYYLPRFNMTIQNHVPGMLEIVKDLQANGIKTYGLTNWSSEDIDTAKAEVPAINLMHGMVVSGIEKVTKPNPRIYELLFERYGIDPKRAIFIDDRADNVEAFQKFGGTGFLQEQPFEESAPKFRRFLEGFDLI